MCGIYGAVGASITDLVPQMGETLVHRGPDADGITTTSSANLGCRRLAIVDVVSLTLRRGVDVLGSLLDV